MQTKSLFLVLAIFSVVLTIYNLQTYLQLLTWFYLRILTKQFSNGSCRISTINQTLLCKILCYAFLLFTLLLLFLSKTYAKLCSQNSWVISSQLPKWWISYNPGQNFLNKIEKSSETGQHKKSLISTLACFLTATAKV